MDEKLEDCAAEELIRRGNIVSSAFTLWQGEGDEKKGRFVVNFSIHGKFLKKGSFKTERMEAFASDLKECERLISFNFTAGYRHVHLHPLMHN